MNLHEYQSKSLFARYGIKVPKGAVVNSLEEALSVYDEFGLQKIVVKAQVHAGGRGKAGGVKIVTSKAELTEVVKHLLGTRLVTFQTDADGQPVNQLYLEEPSEIASELYLGAVLDRDKAAVTFMVSTEGGVDIEEVAHKTPEKIIKFSLNPLVGLQPFQCRAAAFSLGFNGVQMKQFTQIAMALAKMFMECDLSLLEINPLVITQAGDLLCLDAKINIDDNALYRQKDLREQRDASQENAKEEHARKWELNYVALDGNIGCMVNGAGLAMATMDMIQLTGGKPANFLDVGGSATQERVVEAFKIILSDEHVQGIFVNIFGGIVRCDLIADGIIGAVEAVGVHVPVVVRLEGNNAQIAKEKLAKSAKNILSCEGFADGAQKIVAAVREGAEG
jgi:succinyl-CoA synthetase beta subunit